MTEIWKPVLGWEGLYEVSSLGNIRSLPRRVKCRAGKCRTVGGKSLNPRRMNSGYLLVFLYPGATPRTVHSLVAEAFIGPRTDGEVTRHLDGDPSNNCISNLAYGSQADNLRDCYTSYDGVAGSGKLRADDVRRIRLLIESGVPQVKIAKAFGVSKSAINHIHQGRTYKYLR